MPFLALRNTLLRVFWLRGARVAESVKMSRSATQYYMFDSLTWSKNGAEANVEVPKIRGGIDAAG